MKDRQPGPGLARNLDFSKENGIEPKVKKISKIFLLGRRGKQTSLVQTHNIRGSGG